MACCCAWCPGAWCELQHAVGCQSPCRAPVVQVHRRAMVLDLSISQSPSPGGRKALCPHTLFCTCSECHGSWPSPCGSLVWPMLVCCSGHLCWAGPSCTPSCMQCAKPLLTPPFQSATKRSPTKRSTKLSARPVVHVLPNDGGIHVGAHQAARCHHAPAPPHIQHCLAAPALPCHRSEPHGQVLFYSLQHLCEAATQKLSLARCGRRVFTSEGARPVPPDVACLDAMPLQRTAQCPHPCAPSRSSR